MFLTTRIWWYVIVSVLIYRTLDYLMKKILINFTTWTCNVIWFHKHITNSCYTLWWRLLSIMNALIFWGVQCFFSSVSNRVRRILMVFYHTVSRICLIKNNNTGSWRCQYLQKLQLVLMKCLKHTLPTSDSSVVPEDLALEVKEEPSEFTIYHWYLCHINSFL